MLISGYNKTERDIIVGEGVGRCNNLIAKVNKGHRPIYRISARKKYDRAVQKILKKKNSMVSRQKLLYLFRLLREKY